MALRMILGRGRQFMGKPGTRNMADWFRPKFSGGEAKPNEIGRYIMQNLYSDGEKIFCFGACFLFPFYVFWRYTQKDFCDRRNENCDRYKRTCMHYPTARRENEADPPSGHLLYKKMFE
ncbi:uncharacterized protein LOC143446185 [Clavelina lepadiformis]|uniref:uncharacterized protein LOC143446185 n=1 Tax=Clavelina lepadiformis TaxID=159417 RepID=UPI004041F7EF